MAEGIEDALVGNNAIRGREIAAQAFREFRHFGRSLRVASLRANHAASKPE